MYNITIEPKPTAKYLGMNLDTRLNFMKHTTEMKKKNKYNDRYPTPPNKQKD